MDIQTRQLEDRDHFVVPVVMLRAGVFEGSAGPVLYTMNELKRSAPNWNGKPIVVYHPEMYSNGLAGNPDVFSRQKIGNVFNTRFEQDSLKAEAWIDVQRVQRVDRRIFDAIQSRQMMEVSTGLQAEAEQRAGNYSGRSYSFIAMNIQADHLAILPDKIGACSIADGAGLLRNEDFGQGLLLPSMAT